MGRRNEACEILGGGRLGRQVNLAVATIESPHPLHAHGVCSD